MPGFGINGLIVPSLNFQVANQDAIATTLGAEFSVTGPQFGFLGNDDGFQRYGLSPEIYVQYGVDPEDRSSRISIGGGARLELGPFRPIKTGISLGAGGGYTFASAEKEDDHFQRITAGLFWSVPLKNDVSLELALDTTIKLYDNTGAEIGGTFKLGVGFEAF